MEYHNQSTQFADGSRQKGVTGRMLKQSSYRLTENICCDPLLEPSQRDGCIKGSQHMHL